MVINDRWGKGIRHKHGGFYTTEYGSGMDNDSHPWEENRGMGFSYGYNRTEDMQDYRSAQELILMLIDVVSRGGNLCLDNRLQSLLLPLVDLRGMNPVFSRNLVDGFVPGNRLDCLPGLELPAMLSPLCYSSLLSDGAISQRHYLIH